MQGSEIAGYTCEDASRSWRIVSIEAKAVHETGDRRVSRIRLDDFRDGD